MRDIREGSTVRSRDGEKLGKVISRGADSFIIEKGVFFKKEYQASYDDVIEQRDGDVILMKTKDELRLLDPYGESSSAAWSSGSDRDVTTRDVESRDLETGAGRDEARVQLTEEQLEVEKHRRETGRVNVHKDVVTEQKEVIVPVEREVVRVESVPATGERPSGASFEKGDVSIPVHEEQVEIHKRPVAKEELRVSKDTELDQERRTETVRKETADVDTRGDVKKTDRKRDERRQ